MTAEAGATVTTEVGDALLTLLLALGDDELVIGHRHSHWTGVAPHLEEDLAFSSIAQDEIGHSVVWYQLAVEHAGPAAVRAIAAHAPAEGDPLDALGLGRDPDRYRHAVLCERPAGDWAYTLARQLVYDSADAVRLEALARSSHAAVADATGPLRREERGHLGHAWAWTRRTARADGVPRDRLLAGLVAALAEAGGMFEALPGEEQLVEAGILPEPQATLAERWRDQLGEALTPLRLDGLVHDAPRDGGLGGRHGHHTEDFAVMWEEMTATYRAHPGASW